MSVSVTVSPASTAEIVMLVSAATAAVSTVKVAVVLPAAMVTVPGTVATTELLLSETTVPPLGAMLESVTVPLTCEPPATVLGDKTTLVTRGAVIFSVPLAIRPFWLAEIVTAVLFATAIVVTLTETDVVPAAIVAVAGTVAAAELLLSITVIPPAGAGRDAEIVAVDDVPPATVDGFKTTVVMSPGIAVTVTFAVVDAPPAVACTATTRLTGTLVVVTANETCV